MTLRDLRKDERVLAVSGQAVVLALSETEAGKILFSNSRRKLEMEAETLRFANGVNGLLVRFIRMDALGEHNMLVMERVYPLEQRALSIGQRQSFFAAFERQVAELHEKGFSYCDLPPGQSSAPASLGSGLNCILTAGGFRLVDAGCSVLKEDVGPTRFDSLVKRDIRSVELLRTVFSDIGVLPTSMGNLSS